jgi:hypothetical protein
MNTSYILLGPNTTGTILMLRPIMASGAVITPVYAMLRDLDAQGTTGSRIIIGELLINALSAFYPELNHHQLIPKPPTIPFPKAPVGEKPGEMHPERMGLAVSDMTIQPALVFKAFAGNTPVGNGHIQHLAPLAEMGKSKAPSVISGIMLRSLGSMHPDIAASFPHLFGEGTSDT